MNITLIIPDSALPAWQSRLDQFNAGSGAPTVSLQQLKQIELDEETARHVAAHQSAMRAQMTTVADEIIAAAGGDSEKILAALQAGREAALQTLA